MSEKTKQAGDPVLVTYTALDGVYQNGTLMQISGQEDASAGNVRRFG
jgi:hypothetical protein